MRIERIGVHACTVPTSAPESDGTHAWDSTTFVTVEVTAGSATGVGYTAADASAAALVADTLAARVLGEDPIAVARCWRRMHDEIRNQGHCGLAYMALSAVDCAVWDLKARLLGLPLDLLLGGSRSSVEIYGSGGFTSMSPDEVAEQLAGWVGEGIHAVKIKVGRRPERDLERVRTARDAIGPGVRLMVDANGAYDRKQALTFAELYGRHGVSWFEEPVASDDLEGLRLLRDRGPSGMEMTAGEYGFRPEYFRRILDAQAVDVLMADVTRCGGITGMLTVAELCRSFHVPLSIHCAPMMSAHVACAVEPIQIGRAHV